VIRIARDLGDYRSIFRKTRSFRQAGRGGIRHLSDWRSARRRNRRGRTDKEKGRGIGLSGTSRLVVQHKHRGSRIRARAATEASFETVGRGSLQGEGARAKPRGDALIISKDTGLQVFDAPIGLSTFNYGISCKRGPRIAQPRRWNSSSLEALAGNTDREICFFPTFGWGPIW